MCSQYGIKISVEGDSIVRKKCTKTPDQLVLRHHPSETLLEDAP